MVISKKRAAPAVPLRRNWTAHRASSIAAPVYILAIQISRTFSPNLRNAPAGGPAGAFVLETQPEVHHDLTGIESRHPDRAIGVAVAHSGNKTLGRVDCG